MTATLVTTMIGKTMLDAIGAVAVRQIKRRIRLGKIVPKSNRKNFKGQKQKTLVNTGALLRSINYRIEGNKVVVGTNVPYAKILHEGGTIRPTNKKWLTIPLCPIAKAKRAPQFKNTFVKFYFDEGKNYGIIFQEATPDPIPLYKLVKRVDIPARPFLFLDDEDKEKIADVALLHMQKTIDKFIINRR